MEAKQTNHDDGGVSLPEDIIFDVLARLPAKPLCRFRCVTKEWRALISDRAFVAAQRSRTGPHLVGVRDRCWPLEVLTVSYAPPQGTTTLDLRRVINRALPDNTGGAYAMTMIVDSCPYAMIIDPAAGRAHTVGMKASLSMWSFGRPVPSGAFKVLRLQSRDPLWAALGVVDADRQLCEVATIMESAGAPEPLSAWRQRSAPPFALSWCPRRRAMSNAVMYFMPRRIDEDVDGAPGSDHRIAAFDFESEEWRTINGPSALYGFRPSALGTYLYSGLTELKGTLGLVEVVHDDDEHYHAIIWLSADLNKSVWVKEYTIRIPVMWELHKLLGVLDDGRILLYVKELELETNQNKTSYHRRGILVFYNPSTKAFTKLMDIFEDVLVMYNGSLLS